MKKWFVLMIMMVTVTMVSIGCYTVITHPGTEENYTAHDYQQDCLSCHPDYHEYPYGYFYGDYPDYWWSTPRWGRYYAYPWWWDYSWYDGVAHDIDDNGQTSPRTGEAKKAERRSSLRPPYSSGNSNISRQGPSGGNTGTVTNSQSDSQGSSSDGNTTEVKEKKEKKEQKKTPRRGSGRKK
jgi:hypothetical protein